MKFRLLTLLAISSIVTLFSCRDFIEEDISEKRIQVYTPADCTATTVSTQTFSWKEVDGALKYNVQVVNGSFNSINSFVADTNLAGLRFVASLTPGTYQWRIKALNSTSSTKYQVYNLQIDSTTNLTNQVIVLNGPAGNSYLNNNNLNFSWSGLYNATSYHLQVTSADFTTTSSLKLDTIIATNGFVYKVPSEGAYKWRVKAINSSSESPFSVVSSFVIDTTPPERPTLTSPIYNHLFTKSFGLFWDRGTVSGSPVRDSIYIYKDSLVTLVTNAPFFTTATSYKDSSLTMGTYFWRVRSFDAAGNKSSFSTTGKFRIQQ